MKMKYNNRLLGFLVGFICPLIILFGINVYQFPDISFITFMKTGFATASLAPWLKLAALFNLAPFFLFINTNRLKTAQGIIFATFLYGFVIVYFTLM